MRISGGIEVAAPKPIVREIDLAADDLLCVLLALPHKRRLSVLDSCGAREPDARFLIAGFDPFETIEAHRQRVRISRLGTDDVQTIRADPLDVLDERLARYRSPHSHPARLPALPAAGACIATFSYDLVHSLERLRPDAARRLAGGGPDVVLAFYDTLIIHDYALNRTQVVSVGGAQRVAETCEVLSRRAERLHENPAAAHVAVSNLTLDQYIAAVCKIKEHIAAGDIYQANFTQQFSCQLSAGLSPESVFWRLRRDHPAPFAAFIRRRADMVVSASPERFLRVEMEGDGRRVEAWPIKGTRPRGASRLEDERLRAELRASEKDRAENVMIVDLLRNDLGRVCRYGSVEVLELCALQEHPTLFHLVSKVRGVLRDEVTAGDLLRAAFPCGSVTGAPKIRAMQIIDELETVPRGLSMGAIGYLAFDGSLDLSVAIRTMVIRDRTARFNVGGGIVADSSPRLEYEESLVKARALFRALGVES